MRRVLTFLLFLTFSLAAACTKLGARSTEVASIPKQSSQVFERGIASVYASSFQGHATASGEAFRTDKLTAAHKTLPFGTHLRVVNTSNGKEVVVRVNDRGPFVAGRVIDLSPLAASNLGLGDDGLLTVEIFRIDVP